MMYPTTLESVLELQASVTFAGRGAGAARSDGSGGNGLDFLFVRVEQPHKLTSRQMMTTIANTQKAKNQGLTIRFT
jgi:hypothetical protein